MSEHTTHNFQSLDKPLTPTQMKKLSQLSSRFTPTSRSFVLEYSYSDFRHNPEEVLLEYFDLYVHQSSWGTTRILFKFPEAAVDYQHLRRYVIDGSIALEQGIRVLRKAGHVLVELLRNTEDSYWLDDGETDELANACTHLRAAILGGDLRALFIPYLAFATEEAMGEETFTPVDFHDLPLALVPAELDRLTGPLETLMAQFPVEAELLRAMAVYQAPIPPKPDYKAALQQLSAKKKDKYLLRIAEGKEHAVAKLRKALTKYTEDSAAPERSGNVDWATVLQQLQKVKTEAAEKAQAAARKAEKERFQELAQNEARLLQEIEDFAESGRGKSYIHAVERIRELSSLAVYRGTEKEFTEWLVAFEQRYGGKPALMRRLRAL